MLTIEVQPPSQVQAGAVLYPPLVISADSDDAIDYIQIALVDAYGTVLVDQLYGTLTASGKTLDDRSASRSNRSKEYTAFPDLAVTYAGVYTIQVTAVTMDYTAPNGAEAVVAASTSTTQIIAYDQSVAAEVPTADEQDLLRRMRRHGGFGVPRAPR
ncbi:hypothetical protein M434DRAFT_34594 [Hypoxylon sp. CO27-5]|nr:hypothetical protein M434DRAFT_34594 [Hypoxylon sp. CO27-5]